MIVSKKDVAIKDIYSKQTNILILRHFKEWDYKKMF
jgi:hypothetical protein